MNIDKSKLKMGIWYEDKDGNMYRNENDEIGKPNKECVTYHVCFPLEVNEHIRVFYDNKDTCRHPLKYMKRTHGWIKGVKGCMCEKCGREKLGLSWVPFAFMKWDSGADTYKIMTGSTHIGGGNEDVILAMANSGDYTLSEAIAAYANACERCMNVLAYKYLNGKGGYAEYSEEWKKCNTVCDYCRE